jgi:acyl-CoA thioesterase
VLPMGGFSFVNADLAVHLHRHPRGSWIGLDARAIAEPGGVGLNQSELFDEDGEVGRCLETLVISRARGDQA